MVHESIKVNFLNDVLAIIRMEDIPDELTLNWNHTPINIAPGSSWSVAQKGAKQIEMIALHDKCQFTAVVCGTFEWGIFAHRRAHGFL